MGFKRKFEIGDKVRVKNPNSSCYKEIGIVIGYSDTYDNYTYKYISNKKVYHVDFKKYSTEFSPNELEKVEDSSNIDTKSNKLSISDLKPGMKVRIRPDLKEGQSTVVYVYKDMENFAGTIATIKGMLNNISDKYNCIYLENIPYAWDIGCFSEIIEEPEEETATSEKIEFPLKEGQVVTLLDGKKYQVIKNNTIKSTCSFCSLGKAKCGKERCHITHINGKPSCPLVIPSGHYFKLYEDQNTEDNSSKSLKISDFKVGMRVRVKEDFDKIITDPDYSSNISSKMKSFKGKELIVEGIGIDFIIAKSYYWLPEWLEIVDESTISSNSIEESPVKEVGIITKVNFTLTDFKLEKLEHSKFTVL